MREGEKERKRDRAKKKPTTSQLAFFFSLSPSLFFLHHPPTLSLQECNGPQCTDSGSGDNLECRVYVNNCVSSKDRKCIGVTTCRSTPGDLNACRATIQDPTLRSYIGLTCLDSGNQGAVSLDSAFSGGRLRRGIWSCQLRSSPLRGVDREREREKRGRAKEARRSAAGARSRAPAAKKEEKLLAPSPALLLPPPFFRCFALPLPLGRLRRGS